MQKYLLGTESGIQGEELGASDGIKPEEVEWQTAAIEGKLDLLVTLDFRMSQYLPVLRYRSAHRHLVRKRRYEHLGYASVYSSAFCGGRSRLGITAATGKSTKVSPKHFRKCAWVILAKKPTWYYNPTARLSGRALTAV